MKPTLRERMEYLAEHMMKQSIKAGKYAKTTTIDPDFERGAEMAYRHCAGWIRQELEKED